MEYKRIEVNLPRICQHHHERHLDRREPSVVYGNGAHDISSTTCLRLLWKWPAGGRQRHPADQSGRAAGASGGADADQYQRADAAHEAILTENRDYVYYATMMDPHTAAVLGIEEIYALVTI